MFMSGALWGLCFLSIFYPVAVDTSGKVTTGIVQMKALIGANLTLQCPFPFHLNHSNVNVYWWREGNDTILQEDSRKLFQVKKGGAYLHLLYVKIPDAGSYRCVAKDGDQPVGKGTRVKLVVYAVPAPLNIVPMPSEGTSSAFLRLQCRSAAFYPMDFNISWQENGTEIAAGFLTEQQPKPEGLYEVISSLEETKPIERGTVYTCKVYHVSNSIPANASYTFANKDFESTINIPLFAGCAVGAVVILLLIISIVTGHQLVTSKGRERKGRLQSSLQAEDLNGAKRNSVNTSQHEDRKERGAADDKLTYADLDLIGSKKTAKPKQHEASTIYTEIKHGDADSKLTYAAPNFTASKKTSESKKKEASPVYAAVKTTS